MKKAIFIGLASMALTAVPAMAGSPTLEGGQLSMDELPTMQNVTVTISGPDGYQQTQRGNGQISMMNDGPLPDGVYTWQMTGNTGKRIVTAKDRMDNGRDGAERGFSYETITQSGSFTVKNGVQVDATLVER